ncbi:MAG TPA: hypothetical protein VFE40_15965 [Jatrophihabitantaceae bacterium]|jgi:hypothetical protein|nr:hypothetical protein [Jatrophihabitantaceae bacterium]
MSGYSRAGATCLVLAPVAGVVSALVGTPVSGKAADLASTFTDHATAARTGLAINAIAATLLLGGIVWFAMACSHRAGRLAVVGGTLGVLGMLAVLFDDAVHISGSLVVDGLSADQAKTALEPLTSGGVFAVGPLSELGDLGIILLAVAALRLGLPRWAAAVLCVGVVGEGIGFAAGSRYLVAAGFALTAVGAAMVVRTAFIGAALPIPVMRQRADQPV